MVAFLKMFKKRKILIEQNNLSDWYDQNVPKET
jgi:hypothetical protein